MKSILEKALVSLVNGDEAKAEALFHKFMVERARQIHESLRQGQDVELTEGWDSEITEEEYFGDGDFDNDEDGADADVDADTDADAGVDAEMDADPSVADADAEADFDAGDSSDADADADFDAGDVEDGEHQDMEGKLDDIEAKIEELTAEFDRLMSSLEDDGDLGADDFGSEDDVSDMGDDVSDMSDEADTDVSAEPGETHDLGDRMEDDMADDAKAHPEDEMAESEDFGDDDADLEDITESVLAELDRIAAPSNTDGKEIGTGRTISGNHSDGALPKHSANDRVNQAKPVMVKATGDAHNDSFERETPPSSKEVKRRRNNDAGVKKLTKVQPKGDASAALNKDFAAHAEGKSIIDGGKKIR